MSRHPRFPRYIPFAVLAFSAPVVSAHSQQIDTAIALSALRDAASICEADHGELWKRSLCGPIALVDRQTRLVVANDTVPGKHYLRLADAFVTTLPPNQYVANTSFLWGGRAWTMVALPLPKDRYARADLVIHESFHREQEALGLRQVDALNNHLDMRPGRTWLRLEYRALSRALHALPDLRLARHHAESGLIFRAQRRAIYPGSDSLEATLEIQEGLPEYTGQRLAMRLTGTGPDRVAQYVRDYETNAQTLSGLLPTEPGRRWGFSSTSSRQTGVMRFALAATSALCSHTQSISRRHLSEISRPRPARVLRNTDGTKWMAPRPNGRPRGLRRCESIGHGCRTGRPSR